MFSTSLSSILAPPQSTADRRAAVYRRSLVDRLADLTSKYDSPTLIFSKMRGAFPADVVGYSDYLRTRCGLRDRHFPAEYVPHLHALHYEWYFTPGTARQVSREFLGSQTSAVCIGVPTVASAAVGERRNVVFMDRSGHSLARFPNLMSASEVHIMDVLHARRLSLTCDLAIFDAPWYVADCLSWLEVASHMVRRGGTIVFALFPSLVRPTAALERDLVLEVAAALGRVDISEDALAYQTPLFEYEALRAARVHVGDWRRGDLVVIKDVKQLESAFPSAPCRAEIDGVWQTFVIGPQVLKLRSRPTVGSSWLMAPVGENFLLPAVSARDAARAEVHLWSSKNRAARVGNAGALSEILTRLTGGESMERAVREYEGRFGEDVASQLRAFLDLEN